MTDTPNTYIRCSIPMDIYEQAATILAEQGLTMEESVILFYKAIVAMGALPFPWPPTEGEVHNE